MESSRVGVTADVGARQTDGPPGRSPIAIYMLSHLRRHPDWGHAIPYLKQKIHECKIV